MKFRTEIEVRKWTNPLDYSHQILCLGSCFARNIAELLEHNKFRVTASPTKFIKNGFITCLHIVLSVHFPNI